MNIHDRETPDSLIIAVREMSRAIADVAIVTERRSKRDAVLLLIAIGLLVVCLGVTVRTSERVEQTARVVCKLAGETP